MKRYKCPMCNRRSSRPGSCVVCPGAPKLEIRRGVVATQTLLYVAGAALVLSLIVFGVVPHLRNNGPDLPTVPENTENSDITGLIRLGSDTTGVYNSITTTQTAETEEDTTTEATTTTTQTTNTKNPMDDRAITTSRQTTTTAQPKASTTQKPTTTKAPTTRAVNIWIEPVSGNWSGNTLYIRINSDGTNNELGSFNVHIDNTDNTGYEVKFSSSYAGLVPLIGKIGNTVTVRGNGTFISAGSSENVKVTVVPNADKSQSAVIWINVHKS